MASLDTYQMLAAHPEWIAPRSDLRVFLGQPGAPEAVKTTVEPGNAFSPGMRTFGVTWWLRFPDEDIFFAPETAPLEELRWSYEEGFLPVIHCRVMVQGLSVDHTLFQDGDAAQRSESVAARLALTNPTSSPRILQVFLALRSLGPAGGPLSQLQVGANHDALLAHGLPLLAVDLAPDAIGCAVGDPSPLARAGQTPSDQLAEDPDGWCFGLLRYDLTLNPGQSWQVALDCPLQSYGSLAHNLPGTVLPRPQEFEARRVLHLQTWQQRFGTLDLDVPDSDFRNAFFAGLQHLLTASVGDQARIAALAYPLTWLRDGVYMIRCLDLAGLRDLAHAATGYVARNDFFGGFGAEGDAPGEGIWALVQHYRVIRDKGWLASVWPDICRKVDWLFQMRRAEAPIQLVTDTPVLPFMLAQRNLGVICMPASEGIIHGTMDHGLEYSVGWVNHWALCGLREAAFAAESLGHAAQAAVWRAEADELQTALRAYAQNHADYFTFERTANSLLWPTHAWADDVDFIAAPFDTWYRQNRGEGDDYHAEPYWLYFESAQAHNALLLGQRQRAWRTVDYRLRHADLPGLYGYREGGDGVGMENAVNGVTLIAMLRGCHKFESITPHGWSQAEFWLLQRAMLVEEWQDGLLLFAGLPDHWLQPSARIAFNNFPTWYGTVSAQLLVSPDGRSATVTVSGLAPTVPLQIRLPEDFSYQLNYA